MPRATKEEKDELVVADAAILIAPEQPAPIAAAPVVVAPSVLEAAPALREVKVKVLRNHVLYLVGEGNVELKTGQVLTVGMDVAQALSLRQIAVLIG